MLHQHHRESRVLHKPKLQPRYTFHAHYSSRKMARSGRKIRIVDHAEIAFSASWWEARRCVTETWTQRSDVKCSLTQQRGSFKKDEEILKSSLSVLRTSVSGNVSSGCNVNMLELGFVQYPRLTMVLMQQCDLGTFTSLLLCVWVYRLWKKRKVVLCVCKPLMFLATTPHAAQSLLIAFTATTEFETCWIRSVMKACCHL